VNSPHDHSGPHLEQITVFGGSGATGKNLIRHALNSGIRVRALVRNPDSLGDGLDGTEVETGSLVNVDDIDKSLKGSGAAICVFGPRPPYTDIFCEAATKTIIASMKKNGVKRLICQTGGMIGIYPENRTFLFEWMTFLFRKRLPLIWLDRLGQENQVIHSGLSWTIVKPPRLVDRQPTGKVVAGTNVKLGLLSSITRGDLAEFHIQAVLSARYEQRAVFVRNQ
jgi:putative NADH-flavin reductase